jgi:hypothetical protein
VLLIINLQREALESERLYDYNKFSFTKTSILKSNSFNNYSKTFYDYYVINSKNFIDIKYIFKKFIENSVDLNKIQIKQIIKEKYNYLRLGILKSEDEDTRKNKIENILKLWFGAELSKLKGTTNKNISIPLKENQEDISILSCNINNIKYKSEELIFSLQKKETNYNMSPGDQKT